MCDGDDKGFKNDFSSDYAHFFWSLIAILVITNDN